MKHGDFTELAENYARYRPTYAPLVRDLIAGILPPEACVADVGAGTGIWSEMLAQAGCRVTAVEPNDAMRQAGQDRKISGVEWMAGSAEATTLPEGAFDLVSMASAFHWADFAGALREFRRILKPGGHFAVLYNPRDIEGNPLLEDIERKIQQLVPGLKRVSTGRSEFCDSLAERLDNSGLFAETVYLEGRHVERQSRERYVGLWESVNDVRVQLGPEKFKAFLGYVKEKIQGVEYIEARYTTRAWIARRKD
jgi:ubiquinone/menaquinone biosynthesis C-methylase UbiE